MRLGINAIGLYPGKNGGVEQYIRNIIAKLEKFEDTETYLFLNGEAFPTFEESERLKLIRVDLSYSHEAQMNGYIRLYQIDVWFCPMFHLIPKDTGIPTVTTILDIQQEYYPQNFDSTVLRARKRLTRETIDSTDLILTISEFSKQSMMEKFGVPGDKIKVTYLDADSSFAEPIDPAVLEEIRRKLPEKFILFPANMWPHKNHEALLKGYALMREKYALPLELVFTGAKERETEKIQSVIEEYGLREHVFYLGYVPQDHMRYIFRCANMLAFPSLFEGFGIPLVEAMAAELPIICSTSTCIPEIVGDAAVLFDGNSPEEIAEAIYKVYTDDGLREKLIREGKARRGLFSWDKCALDTVDYLKSMYKPRPKAEPWLSKHPKVSVITPSYNQGNFIRATIESVLNQTYDNIEYIVMDGGSTDETVSILKEYGERIRWVSEKDGGQADAVNKGIAVATGEIIGWLNSDDTYYPDAVEKAVNALLSHPEVDMVYGEGDYIDWDGNVTGRYKTRMFDYNVLATECIICQPTAFFTKEIVDKVGGLNAELQLCMDYELWMRIGKAGNIMYIPERLATSRMYEENKTLSRRKEVYSECCREVKRHYGFVPYEWVMGYVTNVFSKRFFVVRGLVYGYLMLYYNSRNPRYLMQSTKHLARMRMEARKAGAQPDLSAELPTVDRYPDGWISETYKTKLRCHGDETELVVRGKNTLRFPKPLVLTLEAEGVSKSFTIPKRSSFTLVMPLPSVGDGMRSVKITANQTIVPAAQGRSNDRRALSVRLTEVSFRKGKPTA